jgi:hypothetical protein
VFAIIAGSKQTLLFDQFAGSKQTHSDQTTLTTESFHQFLAKQSNRIHMCRASHHAHMQAHTHTPCTRAYMNTTHTPHLHSLPPHPCTCAVHRGGASGVGLRR